MSNKAKLSRQPTPPVAPMVITVASPGASSNLAPQMPCSDFPGLRYNEPEAVVTISKQIFVAKEKAWAKGCSNNAKFAKDWLNRGVKRQIG